MAKTKPIRPVKSLPKKTAPGGFMGKSPLALVVYGPPGVGKTAFAANFPKPGFIIDPQEEGIRDLVEFGQCKPPVFTEEVSSFTGLMDLCETIALGEDGIETAVFDSWTGFEQLMFAYHCEEYYDGDWSAKGFTSFQQGPKNAAKVDMPRFIDALEAIRDKGISVVLLCHSEAKPFNNPEGADYDRYTPVCDKACWQRLHRWAKAIFFYNYHVEILDKKKTGPRAKANTQAEQRFIYTQWSPAYDAKNRYGLDPLIDAGESGAEAYAAFAEQFSNAAKRGGSIEE